MPQFTEFPHLPSAGTAALIGCFADMPAQGEPFKAFRRRLKAAGLWSRERLDVLLRFLRIAPGDPVVPSPLVRALQGDGADKAIADRLWAQNPILLVTVYERLTERVHSTNELLKYVDSFAYPGARIPGPELRAWLRIAEGIGLFKTVGIRLGLSDLAAEWFARRVERFDLEEFLEEDEDEVEPIATTPAAPPPPMEQTAAPSSAPPAAAPVQVAPAPQVQRAPAPVAPARTDWTPVLDGAGPALRTFATADLFDDAVRSDTVERLTAWWAAQSDAARGPGAADFGIDAEAFRDDPTSALFHLAVAASLSFTNDAPQAAFDGLKAAGALDALHAGLPPTGPLQVDPGALMSASLVARRLAERPDLASEIEQAKDADAVFDLLEAAFSGLFGLELFWMVRTLAGLGVIRRTGAATYGTLPTRALRDVLFRLGFVTSPYAPDTAALRAAARAAAPFGLRAELGLAAFARASGCTFGCAHRRRCTVACRERSDRP